MFSHARFPCLSYSFPGRCRNCTPSSTPFSRHLSGWRRRKETHTSTSAHFWFVSSILFSLISFTLQRSGRRTTIQYCNRMATPFLRILRAYLKVRMARGALMQKALIRSVLMTVKSYPVQFTETTIFPVQDNGQQGVCDIDLTRLCTTNLSNSRAQ